MIRGTALCLLAVLVMALAAGAALKPSVRADTRVQLEPKIVEAQIADILTAPEYNRNFDEDKSWWTAAMELLTRKVTEFVRWLLDSFGIGGADARLARILAWAVIALFIAVFLILTARMSTVIRLKEGCPSPEIGVYEIPSSARLLAEAHRLAQERDFRSAFLRAYLASIAYLNEGDVLRFTRSRTNWEYLRELRDKGRDDLADDLRPLTSVFDRKFYGREDCLEADYDNALAAYERVRQRLVA